MAALAARLRSAIPLPKDAGAAAANVSPLALLLLMLALGGLGLTVTGMSPEVPDRSIQAPPIEPEAALLPRGELPIIGDPIRDLTIWYGQRVSDANRAAVENLRGRFLTPVDPLSDQVTTDLYGKMLVITIPLLTLGGLVLGYLIMVARTTGESAYAVRAGGSPGRSAAGSWTAGTASEVAGLRRPNPPQLTRHVPISPSGGVRTARPRYESSAGARRRGAPARPRPPLARQYAASLPGHITPRRPWSMNWATRPAAVNRSFGSPAYPHLYPQPGRDSPELAGAHRNTRTQPDSVGGSPRFRYAVPTPPSSPRSEFRSRLFGARCWPWRSLHWSRPP